ncbi:hypothetical protein Tco_0789122 [Tanacetum coccineum]
MEIKRQKKVYRLDADMEYDPSNVNFAEWSVSKFSKHMTMDWYTKNALWVYWIRGDDEEVLTEDELSDLQEGSLSEGDEIAKIFRIEIDIFHFETPLCTTFNEFNYLRKIDVDVLTKDISGFKTYEEYKDEWIYQWNKGIPWDEGESSNDAWSHYSPIDEWKDYEHTTYIETEVNSSQNTYNYVCQMFKDHAGTSNDDDVVQAYQGWFDNHGPMENNDDDIGDLGD